MVFCPRWGVNVPWTAPAYLIEAVRSRGFSVQSLDYNIRLYSSSQAPELWTDNQQHQFWKTRSLDFFLDQIDLREINAAVVGFTLTETNIRFSIELARRLRKLDPNKIILFGGHRIFFPEDPDDQVPLDACDAVVRGEGELTLLDILTNGLNRNKGTFTRGNSRWEYNGDRELIEDLDQFPWPRYEDVNWDLFPDRSVSIMGSRGCVNHCSFCNDIVRAECRYRKRSAEHIAEEMLYHKARRNVSFVGFNDPLMNGHYGNLDRLCDILLDNNFNRPWGGNLAVRGNMDVDLMRKANKAGLKAAVIGLESGSPDVLRFMHKRFTVEEAEWFISAVCEAGIAVELNLIVGFPGETEEHFQQTLRFIKKLAPKVTRIVSVATLNLDHSYLWDNLDEFGVVKQEKDRHISWYTRDGANTYEFRCDRANRLLAHAHDLGLTHDRFDVDIERRDTLIGVKELEERAARVRRRHRVKQTLQAVHLWGPAKLVKSALSRR